MTGALPDHAVRDHTASPPLRIVLYFTKGLGDVVLAEAHELIPGASVVSRDERFAIMEVTAHEASRLMASSRTVDDLRLLVTEPRTVATEHDFATLCEQAALQTRQLLAGSERETTTPWSVTISARDPSWRRAPRWKPDGIIGAALNGADPTATTRSPVDLRLQVDRAEAHVSLNLTERPVGKRDDGAMVARPGALRPTVAAALVRMALADADPAATARGIYDPFCGTGTIVAEAARIGLPVFASDIDIAAVGATRTRLAQLPITPPAPATSTDREGDLLNRVFVHDVLRGIPGRVTARIIVSNLPWGKQVKVDRRSELFDATAAMVARGLAEGGSCALLTSHEDQLAAHLRRHVAGSGVVTARRIGLLGQTPGIIVARRS